MGHFRGKAHVGCAPGYCGCQNWKWDPKGIQQAPEGYAQLHRCKSPGPFPATWWQYGGSHHLNTHRQLSLTGICPVPISLCQPQATPALWLRES